MLNSHLLALKAIETDLDLSSYPFTYSDRHYNQVVVGRSRFDRSIN